VDKLNFGSAALGVSIFVWLAAGFSQSLVTNTAVPNAWAATLPLGLSITDSRRVCDSGDCWMELQILNESGIPERQIVENLPGVRHSGLGDIAASLCGSPDWFRFRQPCTYFLLQRCRIEHPIEIQLATTFRALG
jgi:hypothetical protein